MQYNQPMIDLVYAIRAHLSPSQKSAIKTTNPELLEDLAEIHRASTNTQLRNYIESLLRLAGSTWFDLLKKEPRLPKAAVVSEVFITRPLKAEVISLARPKEITVATGPAVAGVH